MISTVLARTLPRMPRITFGVGISRRGDNWRYSRNERVQGGWKS
jgi:hypothetical protein